METRYSEFENLTITVGTWSTNEPNDELIVSFIGRHLAELCIDNYKYLEYGEYIYYRVYILYSGHYLIYKEHQNPGPGVYKIASYAIYKSMYEMRLFATVPDELINIINNIVVDNA